MTITHFSQLFVWERKKEVKSELGKKFKRKKEKKEKKESNMAIFVGVPQKITVQVRRLNHSPSVGTQKIQSLNLES